MKDPVARCPTNLAGCGDKAACVTGLQVERVCGRFTRGLQPQHDCGWKAGRGGNWVGERGCAAVGVMLTHQWSYKHRDEWC